MSGLRPPLSLGHLFQARGGYQPDRTECNRDLSGKLGLACPVCTPRNRVEIVWAASSSETTLICSPARAGKTRAFSPRVEPSWAHPRVCGENSRKSPVYAPMSGSSPRVRGKRTLPSRAYRSPGLIPACAGKTRSQPRARSWPRAHPRVCGENCDGLRRASRRGGSSPRVRGKPHHSQRVRAFPRLIPACAGKTSKATHPQRQRPAHPRVCGENRVVVEFNIIHRGSSPRVRGKPALQMYTIGRKGLIPACAGKTLPTPRPSGEAWAHPRVCGENSRLRNRTGLGRGSSPRVRGKQPVRRIRGSRAGLIPACAGKTAPRQSPPTMNWAHPRVCGENTKTSCFNLFTGGSSPRVRGKLVAAHDDLPPVRLIPACAGKTAV